MTRKNAERQEAIDNLHQWLAPGDTVYTILRHVSRSGMQREIGIVIPLIRTPKDGGTVPVSYSLQEIRQGTGFERGACFYRAEDVDRLVGQRGSVDFRHPNYAVATALGERQGKRDGVIVGGCGMDMGFHLVYNLGRVLWPDGYGCVGDHCQSNDHANGDRNRTPHDETRPHWHKDGGYALRQEWL